MRSALVLLACVLGSAFGAEQPEAVTIAAKFHRGRAIVSAKLNGAGPFAFLLDTACTIPTVHPAIVDELSLVQRGFVRIHGIAGVERAPTYPEVSFDLNGALYQPRRVAAIPSERQESRRRRDGVIGSGFFERFVVEIDGPKQTVRVYPAAGFAYEGPGEIVPFRFREEIPVIHAALVYPDATIEGEWEVDTGCDSGLCVGGPFVAEHKLLERGEGRADEKFGVGGSAETRNGTVPALRLGGLEIEKPQADFFIEGSPVEAPLAGHIGAGVFQKRRVIFDYPRKRLIVVP